MEQIGAQNLRELLRILIRNLGILEKSEASCCGTTVTQCHALVEIGRSREVSLNALADLLVLDKSTMSRTINNLVESGQVTRELHSEDRRYVSIKLTKEGDRAFQGIETGMKQYYENIFLSIPEDKREQVIESLELVIRAAKENKCCQDSIDSKSERGF
jgi:DNA-binding MarR family transcriptional regulator